MNKWEKARYLIDSKKIIDHIEFIERGYEDFEKKISALGASMIKTDAEDEKAVQKFRLKVG